MAIFGSGTSRPVHWLQTGLTEARRVGRIHQADGNALATGFVFDGRVISDELKDLPLFLTSNHCVSNSHSQYGAIRSSEAAIVFQQMQSELSAKGEASFLQSLSESIASELNYTLLLLDRWPGSVGELKLAPRPPAPGDKVFVVAYPRGGGLSISLDDNLVVEAAGTEMPGHAPVSNGIQYRAPTEPGCSGAPVFNEHWEIVAVHAGRSATANFGISIEPLLQHARNKLAGLSIPRVVRDSISHHDDVSPTILKEATSYFSVFISYRHADAAFARRLYNALEANGVKAWLDEAQMVPGQFIDESIQKGIAGADRFVVCCSKASLENSWWVDSEVNSIFEKERQLSQAAGRKLSVVIPVLLDDYLTDGWKGAKAAEFRSRLGTDFKQWRDDASFAASFEKLLRALRSG